MEQFLKEDGGTVDFDSRGSRTKTPLGKSQVSRNWKVEKSQEMHKVEVEQFIKEEGVVDREKTGSNNCIGM